jgi:ketosteroid isomerase-like protein
MPDNAVEVVTATYAAWNAGDWGLEHFHSDAEWELIGKMALDQTGTIHGRDAVLDYWKRFWSAWKPGARWDITEVRHLGEGQVLAIGRLHTAGRSSGIESSAPVIHLWTVQDGLVVRFVSCDDRTTALKAAGV